MLNKVVCRTPQDVIHKFQKIFLYNNFYQQHILKLSGTTILYVLVFIGLMIIANHGFAHEAWVLTPEQFKTWNAKPRPEIFTSLNSTNVILSSLALAVIAVVVWLDRQNSKNGFLGLTDRLSSYSDYATVGVRWSLAVMLCIAAFGLNPRHGTRLFEASTLVAPDLELRLLHGNWQWLAWAQAPAMITLITGIYIRTTAFVILLIDILGLYIFGYRMIAYAGIVGGIALYLLLAGPGKFSYQLPTLSILKPIHNWLIKQPLPRAQLLMRFFAGSNLLYLGIEYKFMQPNLSMAFVEMGHVYTFGFEPATFVFCMFLVETIAGLLMVLGMMMRPLSFVLFTAFIFLAYALKENPIGHIIFYGILWASVINGAGSWSEQASESITSTRNASWKWALRNR